jgi:hypothetical protein
MSRSSSKPRLGVAARVMALAIAGLASGALAQPGDGGGQAQPQRMVGRVPYEKKATRAETLAHMLGKLQPMPVKWGEFHMLGSFPFKGHRKGDLVTAWPPEAELATMGLGGAGPDLSKVYVGKNDSKAAWRKIGSIENIKVDFRMHGDPALDEQCVAYLYGTVQADAAATLEIPMGSDDGIRLWLNGRLIHDKDLPRGLDPFEDVVKMDFSAGTNHVLIKISQGVSNFEYQMMSRPPLPAEVDAALNYYLESDFPSTPEAEYYRAITIPVPKDVVLEVGGLDVLPDGRPVVCTRRGEIYIVDGAYADPPSSPKFQRFAFGLHEPLGLAVRVERRTSTDGVSADRAAVYCVQRGELTRLIDLDGDEVADEYTTISDAWGVSGNYHEFAFGPKFDRAGNAWITLNVGFCGSLGKSIAPYRGWAVRVDGAGAMQPWSDGLRSPNGIGFWTDGEAFYVDNQGDYVGTCRMTHMGKDSWAGHPASTRWRTDVKPGEMPAKRERAVLWFPYPKMGQSTADILLQQTFGAGVQTPGMKAPEFGPFEGQLFFGDQTLCLVTRGDLEQIEGVYQGACFPFRSALDCGVNRICWGQERSMFVGQTDRGWGSIGRLRYGLQRLVWTGKTPFECQTMHVKPDGFELTFTEPIDVASASDPASYAMESWTYEYFATYGSPEIERQRCQIVSATVTGPTTVRLSVQGLREGGEGFVYHLRMPGVRNKQGDKMGRGLLHADAYYTLQRLPKS